MWKPYLLWLTLWSLAASYKIDYIDCSHPTNIRRYDMKQTCGRQEELPTVQESWNIVQSHEVEVRKGWRCQVEVSRFRYLCGVWGHLKSLSIPEIRHKVSVTSDWCRSMVHSRTFKPPGLPESYALQPGNVNIFPVQEVGTLRTEDEKITCIGQQQRLHGQIFNNVLVTAEYAVSILEETFLVKDEAIEVQSEHISLPCAESDLQCATGEGTFVWNTHGAECPLQFVRPFNPVRIDGTLLYDFSKKIVLNTTHKVAIPGCHLDEIVATDYPGIYLVSGKEKLPDLEPHNLRIDLEMRSLAEYTLFEAERLSNKVSLSQRPHFCQTHPSDSDGTPTQVQGLEYGLGRGQLIYLFQCVQATAEILTADHCYLDIPIKLPTPGFVDPKTLLLKKHSPVIKCDQRFPITIRAQERWITISPHLAPALPPDGGTLSGEEAMQHESLQDGGLYTTAEQELWEQMTNYPQYHRALLQEISLGACASTGTCGTTTGINGVSPYDLRRLIKDEEQKYDLLSSLSDWVVRHGAWLSFAVLTLTAIQLLINLATLAVALFYSGPAAGLAVIFTLMCQGPRAYRQVARRNQRFREREQQQELPELIKLDPRP
jgi:hypothetical protein